MTKDPAKITVALNAFGVAAIVSSILFLGGSFYVTNEVGRACCLGAFFSGLLGSILLFGFAKVIGLLDAIRSQAVAVNDGGSRVDAGAESKAG